MNLFDASGSSRGSLTGSPYGSAYGNSSGGASRTEYGNREIDITPMINIVFLLLIFFMLAGTLVVPDPLTIDGVRSMQGEKALRQLADEELRLSIDQAGRLSVNGSIMSRSQFDEMIERFRALVKPVEAQTRTSHALARLPVSIKADAALPVDQLLALMQQLRDAGLTQVTLLSVRDSR